MSDAQTRTLVSNLLDRLHQVVGVEAVSHASAVPMGYFGVGGDSVVIDGAAAPANPTDFGVGYNVVSPEYFQTMGIDLMRGRAFTDADNEQGRDVAVISESMARKYWPNQDPMGHTFRKVAEKDRKLEVVGIARDAEFQLFGGGKTRPFLYLPYAQHVAGNSLMVVQLKTRAIRWRWQKPWRNRSTDWPESSTVRGAKYEAGPLYAEWTAAVSDRRVAGYGDRRAGINAGGDWLVWSGLLRGEPAGTRNRPAYGSGASRGSVFRMIYRQSMIIVGRDSGSDWSLRWGRADCRQLCRGGCLGSCDLCGCGCRVGVCGAGVVLFSGAASHGCGTDDGAARGLTGCSEGGASGSRTQERREARPTQRTRGTHVSVPLVRGCDWRGADSEKTRRQSSPRSFNSDGLIGIYVPSRLALYVRLTSTVGQIPGAGGAVRLSGNATPEEL